MLPSRMTRSERKSQEAANRAAKLSRRPVAVLNPLPGGVTHLSPERAFHHVQSGAAAWRLSAGGPVIEFIGSRHDAAARMAAYHQARNLDAAVGSGIASHDQIAALPAVRPADLLAPSPRRNFGWQSSVYRSPRAVSPHRLKGGLA
jgi:hypothetical protein